MSKTTTNYNDTCSEKHGIIKKTIGLQLLQLFCKPWHYHGTFSEKYYGTNLYTYIKHTITFIYTLSHILHPKAQDIHTHSVVYHCHSHPFSFHCTINNNNNHFNKCHYIILLSNNNKKDMTTRLYAHTYSKISFSLKHTHTQFHFGLPRWLLSAP